MGAFFRIDETQLVRGAGRLMVADSTETEATEINDVFDTTTFDAQGTWEDLGATRQGITIAVNNTETAFDVDQVLGEIGTAPDTWTCTVATQLAEMTLEHLQLVWEGSDIDINLTPSPNERKTGFAGATSYTERRLAIGFKKRLQGTTTDVYMLFYFHRAVRSPQEVSIAFNKGGDAMTIPATFKILADSSQGDPRDGFGFIFEQVAGTT